MGYVYILTNPSFKENWIKIGRTDKEVDIRSKQLDNTAVPLPFEIFATIKTKKYVELEKTIHDQLTKLTDKRIRSNREFYNMNPDDALDIIKGLCNLIDDAEFNVPDPDYGILNTPEKMKEYVKQREFSKKGEYIVEYDDYFYLYNGICDAKMKVENGNNFILLAGSKIDSNIYSSEEFVKRYRSENEDHIRDNEVIDDIIFTSPSTPAVLVRGGACNGKFYWKTKDNRPLNDFIKYINK